MSEDLSQRIEALQAELGAVKKREAEFRTHMVREFLDRGERNTYLHTLREERSELVKRQQEAFADLELLTRKLEAEGERAAALEAQLSQVWRSWPWRLFGSLASKGNASRKSAAGGPGVEGGIFTYYLHTSPFRIYRDGSFTLRGWAWPHDGRAITAVRASVDGRAFLGRHGLDEPEVIAKHGAQPKNPRPGFEVTFETPPGRHSLSLEAQIEGNEWLWIVRTSIWCEPKAS